MLEDRNKSKKLLYVITVLAVFVCAVVFFSQNKKSGVRYITEKITRGDIKSSCTATGTVNPLTTVLVGTQVSGRIKNLYADFNSPVREGELIAEIDPSAFEAQLEQARANLLSARANLKKAKASFLDAQRNLERRRELLNNNIIGRSEFDTADTNCAVAESQVGVAEAQVVQAEASFKFAETNLRYTKIVSPVDGIVISRDVDIGQTVAAAFQTPTLFSIAKDLGKMQINTNVDEADIGKIEVEQEAEFTVDAYPYTVFNGQVFQIRNAPVVSQNVVTYDVVIKVDNPGLKLKPGMTANVSIIISTKQSVLRIPNSALRFRPKDHQVESMEEHEHYVWIVKDHEPEYVKVKTGIDDFIYTELVSADLLESQELITGYLEKGKE